jgi:hypothetical protein
VKNREDYLLKYEERLLQSLTATYQSVNRTLALMYALTGITLLVEWGRVTEVNTFGAKFPLNGIEVIAALPVILTVLTTFLDYSLITASRALRELKLNSEEVMAVNADAKPVSLSNLDLFGTGVIGFTLSFARREVIKLIEIKVTLKGLKIPQTFIHVVHFAFMLFWYNNRIVRWIFSIFIRITFIFGIMALPLVGSALMLRKSLGSVADADLLLRLVMWAPFLLLAAVATSLALCTFLLVANYSADYLDSIEKDFAELAERVKAYQHIIKETVQLIRHISGI